VSLEDPLEVGGVDVVPVGILVSPIGESDRGEDLRMGGGAVVAGESAEIRVMEADGVGHDRRLIVGSVGLLAESGRMWQWAVPLRLP
jgi:hypothetical protein